MKDVITTNPEDIYLQDPEKSMRVTEWLQDTFKSEPVEYVDEFIKRFSRDDKVVQDYLDKIINYDKLFVHVQLVRTRLPTRVYMSLMGVDMPYLVKRAKFWADSEDGQHSIAGLKLLKDLYTQQDKLARIKLSQYNINVAEQSDEKIKGKLVESVLSKIEARAGIAKPTRTKRTRKPAREGEDTK